MHRIDGPRHSFQRLTAFIAGFLLVCIVATANAGVRVNATSARYAGATATGVRTTTTFEATLTGTANGVRNYAVPVPVSSSTLGGLAGAAMKRIGPAAALYQTAKSIVDGAGWAIDELTDQVVDGPASLPDMAPPGTQMACTVESQPRCVPASSPSALCGAVMSLSVHHTICTNVRIQGSLVFFQISPGGGTYAGALRTFGTSFPVYGTGYTPAPVSDYDLGQLLKNHPHVVNAILIDPETGAPIHTPELVQAMNDLRKSIEAANGIDPGPDATPKDPMETQPMESAWPGFCSWATTVCDWLDWTRSDGEPHKDLPETELQIQPDTWTSGIGGGSCPAPETFTITVVGHQGQAEFDWQPACDFATTFKPFFIAMCSIVAVFILAGLRSGAKP